MYTILEEILELKKQRVELAKSKHSISDFTIENSRPKHVLRHRLIDNSKTHIIAEIKRASPSKGVINSNINVAEIAKTYADLDVAAISVLTEEDRFGGSLDDLKCVRKTVDVPILRKDFIYDEFQIYEAVHAGADVILLIVAMLDDRKLFELFELAEQKLGIDALVEVHTLDELKRANAIGAKIIGINNRDLHSFQVSLNVSRELIKHADKDALMISESGISSFDEISELKSLGFNGFLIGESLMRSGNVGQTLRNLSTEIAK